MIPKALSLLALIAHLNNVGWLNEANGTIRNVNPRHSQADFLPTVPFESLRMACDTGYICTLPNDRIRGQ